MHYLLFFVSLLITVIGSQSVRAEDSPDVIELVTNIGTITIKLDYQNAPVTSNNFIAYVKNGFYRNTMIHRVIKGFVIQGGGYNKLDGTLKTTLAPITNESSNGLSNRTGTIAMARTSDPNSATSQFFINLKDNQMLDYGAGNAGYAVFGEVIAGMDVVREIEELATYNELPFTKKSELVYIENVYSSYGFDSSVSKTRISINGSGKVISDPAGIKCGKLCNLSTTTGSITLKAKPVRGNLFIGWCGDCRGFNQTITIDSSNGNHNCVAGFTKSLSASQ